MIRQHLQTLATLATPLSLPVERISGHLHGTGEPAQVLFAGARATADFVAGALMTIGQREPLMPLRSPLALRGSLFEKACAGVEVAAVEVPRLWRPCLPPDMALSMPSWVSQEIRARDHAKLELPAAVRKEAMRHWRREHYSVELATGGEAISRFFAEFYRPYVTARFGPGAVIVDEDRFLAVGRRMTLAKLSAGGEWVAGMLFRLRAATLELGWFGSRAMPPQGGASEVLDSWVIGQASDRGACRAVLGHSRPSLADGVVRYKARFGAVIRPTRFPQRLIGIAVRRPTRALAAALNAARFITFDGARSEARELVVSPALSTGFPGTYPSS